MSLAETLTTNIITLIDQSLNVVTWDNLRAHITNSSPTHPGHSARRLGVSLLLSFGISLPLGCDPQLNPENGGMVNAGATQG